MLAQRLLARTLIQHGRNITKPQLIIGRTLRTSLQRTSLLTRTYLVPVSDRAHLSLRVHIRNRVLVALRHQLSRVGYNHHVLITERVDSRAHSVHLQVILVTANEQSTAGFAGDCLRVVVGINSRYR